MTETTIRITHTFSEGPRYYIVSSDNIAALMMANKPSHTMSIILVTCSTNSVALSSSLPNISN